MLKRSPTTCRKRIVSGMFNFVVRKGKVIRRCSEAERERERERRRRRRGGARRKRRRRNEEEDKEGVHE